MAWTRPLEPLRPAGWPVPPADRCPFGKHAHPRRRARGVGRFKAVQGLAVVPGHPRAGGQGDLLVVTLEGRKVAERVGEAQLGGVDQAHEEVAHPGPVLGPVE
jgi:hypothetical protein